MDCYRVHILFVLNTFEFNHSHHSTVASIFTFLIFFCYRNQCRLNAQCSFLYFSVFFHSKHSKVNLKRLFSSECTKCKKNTWINQVKKVNRSALLNVLFVGFSFVSSKQLQRAEDSQKKKQRNFVSLVCNTQLNENWVWLNLTSFY